ncbi:MAG: hypothetical protein ACE5JK_07865 [Candidatus Omnitrophota bacterium]
MTTEYHRGSLEKHEAIKELILQRPEIVGVDKDDVVNIETELPLIRRKRPVAQPDIVIEYSSGKNIRRKFIEVKSSNCKRAITGLQMQMKKVSKYLKYKKIKGDVVGVYCQGSLLNISLMH